MSYFKVNMHQNRFLLGLRPRSSSGSIQRSPRPLAGFKGPSSNGARRDGRDLAPEKNSGAAIGSDAWPVRRQTYGYLPNFEALPPFHYSSKLHVHPLYTAILISNRDTLAYSVKLHLRDGRTDVASSGRPSYGEREPRCFI